MGGGQELERPPCPSGRGGYLIVEGVPVERARVPVEGAGVPVERALIPVEWALIPVEWALFPAETLGPH